jgi:hypothetical protein
MYPSTALGGPPPGRGPKKAVRLFGVALGKGGYYTSSGAMRHLLLKEKAWFPRNASSLRWVEEKA